MSAPPPDAREPWGWTRSQRVGLGTLLGILLIFLTIGYCRRSARLDAPVVVHGRELTLPSRIDPNTASAVELSRVPHLGEKLAARIVGYRDTRKSLTADNIVYHAPEDLSHIAGLGGKTLEQVVPYLQFPGDAETQPGADDQSPLQ